MTVQNNNDRNQAIATDGQTVFPYNFQINAASDIAVWQRASGALPNDSAYLLIYGTNYLLTGIGNPTGGTFILNVGATGGDFLAAQSILPADRDTSFTPAGLIQASNLNNEFDNQVLISQRILTTVNSLTPRYPYSAYVQSRDLSFAVCGDSQFMLMDFESGGFIAVDYDPGNSAAALQEDLASHDVDKGASMVGLQGSGTVQNLANASANILAGSATSNQVLLSQGLGVAPTWSTATYLASTTINRLLYSSDNNVVNEISTANSSVLTTNSSGVPSWQNTLPSAVQLNITQLGTLTSGVWNATPIHETFGGTNQTSYALGDILYASADNTLSKLPGNTVASQYFLAQTGTGSGSSAPSWELVPQPTPSALTRTNDTNVNLTLGGSPTNALLQAVSLTLSWVGELPATRGGTGLASFSADDMIYASASNTLATFSSTAFSRNLLAGSNTTAWQSNLSLVPGTDIQAYSASLASIAGLVIIADKIIYTTGVDTYDTSPLTSFMRTALSSVDAPTAASNLEVLALSGGTMTGALELYGPPATGIEAATRNYVDSVVLNIQIACLVAPTADLSGYTYNNGVLGVGATLTAGSNGAFSADGISPIVNNRILVLFQADPSQNGAYELTIVGDAGTPAVLTRSADYDSTSEIQAGDLFTVVDGTTYGTTIWMNSQVNPVTVGTTAITFRQLSITGTLLVANNLSDVDNPATSRINLGLEIGTDVQAYSDTLQSISPLGTVANVILYTTGTNVWAETSLTSFSRTLIANSSSSGARSTLGLVIGTNVQAWFAGLDSIGGLSTSANQMIYTTAFNAYATTSLTALSRTLLAQTTSSGMRSTLGTVIGTDVQAWYAGLDSIGALGTSANQMIYTTALNTYATTSLTALARTLLSQTTAAAMQSTIGTVIGTDVQAQDAGLQSIANLTTAADKMIYTTALDVYATTDLTSFSRTLLASTTAAAARSTLGVSGSTTPPTQTVYTTGSGSYVTPTGVSYLEVEMIGGGGGGGGSAGVGTAGTGGTGGITTFGTSLLTCNGGLGGTGTDPGAPGTGGTATIGSGATGRAVMGGNGCPAMGNSSGLRIVGGQGASSPFCGGGQGAINAQNAGGTGVSNTGVGGGGASPTTAGIPGKGGGAGGYIKVFITPTASQSFSYAVGGGGSGGTAGTSGASGGLGGSGIIIINEYY